MLGRQVGQVLGLPVDTLLVEAERESFVDALDALSPDSRTATGILSRWEHSGGEARWLEGNLLALVGPDGAVSGYRGTHRDVTERKHQQERILRLTRMLQMQSGINAAVVRIRERDALLREACRLALQVGGYEDVMISLVEPDGRRAVAWYKLGADAECKGEEFYPVSDGTESDTSLIGRALRAGEITISTDL